jgi:hypothetical protein
VLSLDRAAAWRLALALLVVGSAAARVVASWLRATPNYFPDEYIYSSLARSLAAGRLPEVRGHVAHFPALLQPLVTAPAWWFGSLETGYRVTQAIDSLCPRRRSPCGGQRGGSVPAGAQRSRLRPSRWRCPISATRAGC